MRAGKNKQGTPRLGRAVKFGQATRYHNVKAFPFWFPFIPYPYLETDRDENPPTSGARLGLLGHTVAADGIIEIPISMSEDLPYHLLNVKYNAYVQDGVVDTRYTWYVPTALTPQPKNLFQIRPLYKYLKVSLIITSIDTEYTYGGDQYDPLTGLTPRRQEVGSLQGFNSGLGMLRTPWQIPKNGMVTVRVENRYTETLIVSGTLFGYKITV